MIINIKSWKEGHEDNPSYEQENFEEYDLKTYSGVDWVIDNLDRLNYDTIDVEQTRIPERKCERVRVKIEEITGKTTVWYYEFTNADLRIRG